MSKEYVFKIVSLGNGGVGKTSLIRRFADNKFEECYLPTIGVDITTKEVPVEGYGFVNLVLVDSGGQEYLGSLRPNYYYGSRGVLIIFDLTDTETFEQVEGWIKEISDVVQQQLPMTLVGNKNDLIEERIISFEEAQEKAKELGMPYHESSAKTGENVTELYRALAKRILESLPIEME